MDQYVVLGLDGKSRDNKGLTWSLPKEVNGKWEPGKWHRVRKGLILATSNPWGWVQWTDVPYLAEGRGDCDSHDDFAVYREGRLLRPLPIPQWWEEARRFVASLKDMMWLRPDGQPLESWRVFKTWDAARADRTLKKWWVFTTKNAIRNAAKYAAEEAAKYAAKDASREVVQHHARDTAMYAVKDAFWATAKRSAWKNAVAGHASRLAAEDAALYVDCVCICDGTGLASQHVEHTRERWEVWRKGYGVAGEVGGVLYVYETLPSSQGPRDPEIPTQEQMDDLARGKEDE